MNSVAGCQAPPNPIQLAVAVFFITQVLAPFGWRVLTGKHGGGFQIRPCLNQMVQDFNPILRIATDSKIVNEEDLDPGIVLQPFPVPAQIIAPAQDKQFVQKVTIIHEHTAVVPVTGLIAKRRQEVGLASLRNAVDANIQALLSETERKELLDYDIVVTSLTAGHQVLRKRTLVNEPAEAQVGVVPVVHGLKVLRAPEPPGIVGRGCNRPFQGHPGVQSSALRPGAG